MMKRELADRLCELAKTARGLAANGGGQDPAYGALLLAVELEEMADGLLAELDDGPDQGPG